MPYLHEMNISFPTMPNETTRTLKVCSIPSNLYNDFKDCFCYRFDRAIEDKTTDADAQSEYLSEVKESLEYFCEKNDCRVEMSDDEIIDIFLNHTSLLTTVTMTATATVEKTYSVDLYEEEVPDYYDRYDAVFFQNLEIDLEDEPCDSEYELEVDAPTLEHIRTAVRVRLVPPQLFLDTLSEQLKLH